MSICVPIYGVEKYIEACARSLFGQTYDNLEYIFVDDGSPDKSVDVLKQVMEDYPTRKDAVRIITHGHNRGLAAARTTSLQAATGDFIVIVDSDDKLRKDAVELFVKKQKATDADIVVSDYYKVDGENTEKVKRYFQENKEKYLKDVLIGWGHIQHYVWGLLIKSSLIKDNDIHPKEGVNFGEDYQVFSQLLYYAKKFVKLDESLCYYTVSNANSYTSGYSLKRISQDYKTFDVIKKFFADKGQEYLDAANRGELSYTMFHLEASKCDSNDTIFSKLIEKYFAIPRKYRDCLSLPLKLVLKTKSLTAFKFYRVIGSHARNE